MPESKTYEPVLRDRITLDTYERACICIGVDPDAEVTSEGVRESLRMANWDDGQRFVDLVCEEGHGVDLRKDFTRSGAEEFVATVAAFFLTEQLTPDDTPMPWHSEPSTEQA